MTQAVNTDTHYHPVLTAGHNYAPVGCFNVGQKCDFKDELNKTEKLVTETKQCSFTAIFNDLMFCALSVVSFCNWGGYSVNLVQFIIVLVRNLRMCCISFVLFQVSYLCLVFLTKPKAIIYL